MGLSARLGRRWSEVSHVYLDHQERLSDVVGAAGSLSKTLRMALQSSVLGLGAYLVIGGEASPGVIIASSILLGRSLAPVDAAIANWRGFLATRHSYSQLAAAMGAFRQPEQPHGTTRAPQELTVEELTIAPPGLQKPTVVNVSFQLSRALGWRSWAQAAPARRRSCARWSGSGSRFAERCGWMEHRSINGILNNSEFMLATCRRTLNCSMERLPTISQGSVARTTPKAFWTQPRRLASTR